MNARLREKCGFIDECSGCVHRQLGLGTRRAHLKARKQGVYNLRLDDPAELDRVIRNEERLGRAQPLELTRRAKTDFPPDL